MTMSDGQKLPKNSGAPVSLPFHREFMLFTCVYVLIVFFECLCSLLVSRGLYMSLDVGFWLLIRFFLFSYIFGNIHTQLLKDKTLTHNIWNIYSEIEFTCTLLSDFLNIFEPRTLRTIDPSDYRPFGPVTLLTNDPSD